MVVLRAPTTLRQSSHERCRATGTCSRALGGARRDMPSIDGAPADISSAKLIFDDRLYEQEVLGLKEGQTEEKLQEEITAEARQLGIEPYLLHGVAHTSKPASTVTISSEHRSSVSLDSRGSHSTEFTSDPSRSSKDQGDRPPSFTNSQRQRPWAPDAKEEDVRTSSRPTVRYSYSYSEPQTASESTFSLSSALSGRSLSTKRKRGTSILSMFRKQPWYPLPPSVSPSLRHS